MSTETLWIVVAVVVAVLLIAVVVGLVVARKRRISLRDDEELETTEKEPPKGGSYKAGGGFNFSSGTATAPEKPRDRGSSAKPDDGGSGAGTAAVAGGAVAGAAGVAAGAAVGGGTATDDADTATDAPRGTAGSGTATSGTAPGSQAGTTGTEGGAGSGTAVDDSETAYDVRTPPGGTPIAGGATEARTPPGGIHVIDAPTPPRGTPVAPPGQSRVIDTAEASKDPSTARLDTRAAGTTAADPPTVATPITGTAPATPTARPDEPTARPDAPTATTATPEAPTAPSAAPGRSTAAPEQPTTPTARPDAGTAPTTPTARPGTATRPSTSPPDAPSTATPAAGGAPNASTAAPDVPTTATPAVGGATTPTAAPDAPTTATPVPSPSDTKADAAADTVTAPVAPGAPMEEIEPADGRLGRLRGRLSRSRSGLGQSLLGLLGAGQMDEESWEDVEATLLQADLGPEMTEEITTRLREQLASRAVRTADQARAVLHDVLTEALDTRQDRSVRALPHDGRPAVLLVVGVNGTGKTTTTGKLARVLVAGGHTVTLGAADTFRAAAAEQLVTWGERSGAGVVRGPEGSDPAAVAFDAVKRGTDDGVDAVLLDTAGRLHTKTGLMDELGKVKRVVEKQARVDEVLLVLDATTGQNGLTQARVFGEVVDVTGIALTKLDGTAKGGIVFRVQRELGVPVKLVGLGEGADDLAPFEPSAFVDALLN